MVPVRESDDKLFVVLSFIRRLWILDNERTPKPIRVLSIQMRMVPVRACLVDLDQVSTSKNGVNL